MQSAWFNAVRKLFVYGRQDCAILTHKLLMRVMAYWCRFQRHFDSQARVCRAQALSWAAFARPADTSVFALVVYAGVKWTFVKIIAALSIVLQQTWLKNVPPL